jgi:hypothetical protein
MFIDNLHTKEYYNIINHAALRLPKGSTRKQAKLLLTYTERHHIIPKSLGGDDTEENLVWLTAEEHLSVHLLLPKMVSEEHHIRKMSLAAVRMANPQSKTQKRIIGDDKIPTIAALREEAARLHSAYMSKRHAGKNNPFFRKCHSDKTKEIQRQASANRIVTDEMRINYSNGRKKFYKDYPEKKPNGEKNPRFIAQPYQWENIFTGEKLSATRYEMTKLYPILKSNISQVINGNYNHAKGWKIIGPSK